MTLRIVARAAARAAIFAAVLPAGLPAMSAAQDEAPAASQPAPQAAPPARPQEPPGRQKGSPDASLYIGWPNDGEVVTGRVKVWFGLRNFGVAPAGMTNERTGHHHLLIDTGVPPMNEPIPNDAHHLHFGKGQTETVLDLPPGRHTLQLLLAGGDHVPHDPPIVSRKITITVRPAPADMARSPRSDTASQ
jgi:hypothetical protein